MEKSKGYSSLVGKVLIILFLVIEIYPIFWILMSSLKSTQEFNLTPSYALPHSINFQNYTKAWYQGKMNIYFKNSAIVTIISLFFIVFLSTTSAFALTKMRWKMRDKVLKIFLSGIMVPTAVVLIPLYRMYYMSGMLNTRFCLILTYIAFGLPLSIYLLRGYLTSLPDDIIEAAIIDGASIYKIFSQIVFPLMKTGIVTVCVIQFYFRWNDLIFSMTFISDTMLKTVQTGLLYFSDMYGNRDWGVIFACITISVLPTLIVYVLMNKMVIEGMTIGSVKG
jgi:raffinose/stachyose/melibiose transport system permease protein